MTLPAVKMEQDNIRGSRKKGDVSVVTDAACFNAPEYERNEGTEVFANRQTAQDESSSQVAADSASIYRDPNLYYDMSGDKFLIILNHFEYKIWRQENIPRLSTRQGTEYDVERLESTFRSLGFKTVTHTDCTHEKIMELLNDLCNKNHHNTSCVAVAVMTHGIGDHLAAADILYPVTDITNLLRNATALECKPKLCFIQACREKHIKPKANQHEDISVGEDCFILYSSYEDYVSYRYHGSGSWLMQSLCSVLRSHHTSKHLLRMMPLVHKEVGDTGGNEKQTPVTEFNLNKFLML